MSIFEQASKEALRFSTTSGSISTEDLWNLPLTSTKGLNLKVIAESLAIQLEKQPVKTLDFFDSAEVADPTLQLRFDIVKHIVTSKVAEAKAKTAEKVRDSQRSQIKALIQDKENEALKGLSVEELKALLQ
jgi:hypothetical protein